MTEREIKTLQSIKNDLKNLARLAEGLPQPQKAIFATNLFLTMKKVESLLPLGVD